MNIYHTAAQKTSELKGRRPQIDPARLFRQYLSLACECERADMDCLKPKLMQFIFRFQSKSLERQEMEVRRTLYQIRREGLHFFFSTQIITAIT